jgi:AmmeMemoRadiSam system protein B
MNMSQGKRNHLARFYPLLVWTLFIALTAIGSQIASSAVADDRIRKPAVAGSFYPNEPAALRSMVDGFMAGVTRSQVAGRIIGLMSPHAGYTFSGQVAAYGYREIKAKAYDTVIILGPSHHVYLRGASVGNFDAYATPLGRVPVNRELVDALLDAGKFFSFSEEAHAREHSIETQLPFLQRVLCNFDILPILMGAPSMKEIKGISKALAGVIQGRNVLLVASSDMSHYPAYRDAREVDSRTLSIIETFDPEQVFRSEARALCRGVENLSTTLCGLGSVVTVMTAAKELGANAATVLHYANSGDVAYGGYQEKRRVVGYGAVAFYQQ